MLRLGPPKVSGSDQGNKYILVMVDHFSYFAEYVALPNQEVIIAKAFIEQIVLRY